VTQIRRATTSDVPALLPLVEDYWKFEKIPGFESKRVAVQLARLLSEPGLGGCWISTFSVWSIWALLPRLTSSSYCRCIAAAMLAGHYSVPLSQSSFVPDAQTCPYSCQLATTLPVHSTSGMDTQRDQVLSCSIKCCMRTKNRFQRTARKRPAPEPKRWAKGRENGTDI
jgi:hypothetical protein